MRQRSNRRIGVLALVGIAVLCTNQAVADADPDPDLQIVVDSWSTLPTAVRAGMVATVRAVTDETDRE